MNLHDLVEVESISELNSSEIDQVNGALGPLLLFAAWAGGGAAVGLAAAAITHFFGNGSHEH